jgi:phospholipid/cholesterol/gamma-HCH transport system substrate-binding protein
MNTIRLGVFVVGSLAILTGGVFLIGSNHLTFRSTYRLKTQFHNVAGLANGAEVRVGGMHEGTVRQIDLPNRPDGEVTVQMDLANGTRGVVKKDSQASIQAEGLVGDKYVEITFGSKDAAPIKENDTIASEPPLEMSALFKKADGILSQVQDAVGNLQGSSKDLESISDKINQGTGTVGALVNDKSLYNKVNSGAAAFQEDAEALKHNFLLKGFFQKRGYEDTSELVKHEIQQLPAEPYDKKFELDAKGLFDKPDASKLKNDKPLKPVGEFLQNNRFGLVVVAALSGMKGDTAKENQLTLARAAVVRDYLVKNFRLDDTHIKTIGLGKNPDTPDAGEVEVMVYPAAVPRQAPGHR